MTMGHDQTALQVLLGLGNDPGNNFNISVLPLMRQVGLGDLCLPNVRLDETVLGVAPTDGMNATLQVVTNGDPSGGLYNVSSPFLPVSFFSSFDFVNLASSASTSPSPPPPSSPSLIPAPMAPSPPSFSRVKPPAGMRTNLHPTAARSQEVEVEAVAAASRIQRPVLLCRGDCWERLSRVSLPCSRLDHYQLRHDDT
jgi:hypothetical protein